MKERHILFSGPMVKAILEGRKTMTRRVVKPQPMPECNERQIVGDTAYWRRTYSNDVSMVSKFHCPYGKPGDRLWIKETHWVRRCWDDIVYKADDPDFPYRWTPSIYMPREASRITLEIVSVRVELLQDISETDAKAEGAPAISFGDLKQAPMSLLGGKGAALFSSSHKYGFFELWESINAKRGYDWETNPWVWIIEFKRVEQPK